jgi:hypothetical protein
MYKYLVLAGFLVLAGCPDKGDSGDTSETDADTDADADEIMVEVTWGGTSVSLDITNGTGSYLWGLAETDPSSGDPWTGEDCLYGYGAYAYCHPTSASGVTLEYGASPDNVVEGDTTVFYSSDYASTVTYSLWDGDDCVGSWGADATYYEDYCDWWQ